MTDQDIMNELTYQRDWWEKQIEDCDKKRKAYEVELAKANRLIELLHHKMMEDKK